MNKVTRKFKEENEYSQYIEQYHLLPFRFGRVNDKREILVNEIGDFLIVDKDTVERIVTKKINPYIDIELYKDLLSNFFISESKVPPLIDVIATRYRTKKSFLDHFTALHIFVITLRCEHTCHYCQVSRVTENRDMYDMSISNIDYGIELMMMSPNSDVTMEFQGGEALLAFEKIQYAVEKTKLEAIKYNKNVTFVICTNLAPLNDSILEYCKENNILISTSLDGPEFLHNSNRNKPRSNSYQLAVSGIERCRSALGEDKVSALLTTTIKSLQYPAEIVDEYYSLGFRNIFLRAVSPYGFALKSESKNRYDRESFLVFYKKALSRILEYNLSGEYYREDFATIILKKILTPFPVGYVDLQSPAGMINNVIVFNYNGKVYATDESRMLAEMGDETFLLGQLGKDSYRDIFYSDKSISFSDTWLNESLAGCSECVYQGYCGADPVFHYATQGDMYGYRPTSDFCFKNMEIIRYLFELMDSDKQIEKIFRSWVTGRS